MATAHFGNAGWLLLSVPERGGLLHEVLAGADAIQHALPSLRQLQLAFGYLQAAGLISNTGGIYRRTLTGEAFVARSSRGGKLSLMALCDVIAAAMRNSPLGSVAFQPAAISEAELQSADELYRQNFAQELQRLEGEGDA